MKAERFATIRDGRIVALTDAFPAHELKYDQIPLSKDEYNLIKSLPIYAVGINLDDGLRMISEIARKVYEKSEELVK
jgi:hypothetical protein